MEDSKKEELRQIQITTPHLNEKIAKAVYDVIMSGWIGQNAVVEKFEDLFAKKYGHNYAVAVNSCTSALRLSLALAGVGYGDRVITTPNTFVATNTAILEQGAKPVFADIVYDTGNIDPDTIEDKITDKTKAIMIVDWMGYPCLLRDINKIAYKYNLPVIDDAAQAIGAKYYGVPVGKGYNHYGNFSFQVVKQITTADGGMFTTEDREIYERALKLAWFGYRKEDRTKASHTGFEDYDIPELGFKMRMNAIAASMGIAQLEYIDELLKIRKGKVKIYQEELEGANNVTLFDYSDKQIEGSNYMFPIHVKRRASFLKKMAEHKIEAFVHNFRNDVYTVFGGARYLPVMAYFDTTNVSLPCHHDVSDDDILRITKIIKEGW